MNLPALYALLASRTDANGCIRLPSWPDIAKAAQVHELDDAAAFRALVEKGAVSRVTRPNTYGDCDYLLQRPAAGMTDAWNAALQTVGMRVTHLKA